MKDFLTIRSFGEELDVVYTGSALHAFLEHARNCSPSKVDFTMHVPVLLEAHFTYASMPGTQLSHTLHFAPIFQSHLQVPVSKASHAP